MGYNVCGGAPRPPLTSPSPSMLQADYIGLNLAARACFSLKEAYWVGRGRARGCRHHACASPDAPRPRHPFSRPSRCGTSSSWQRWAVTRKRPSRRTLPSLWSVARACALKTVVAGGGAVCPSRPSLSPRSACFFFFLLPPSLSANQRRGFLSTHPTWKWRIKAYDPNGEWMQVRASLRGTARRMSSKRQQTPRAHFSTPLPAPSLSPSPTPPLPPSLPFLSFLSLHYHSHASM